MDSTRTVPMKVISFGLCRTGTQTIADTLELLGFGTIYHQREVIKRGHVNFWTKALTLHNQGETQLSRAEFDEVLGGFQGAVDLPSALLVDELLDAYPEAQILLTSRDPDTWVASMNATLMHARSVERPYRGAEGLREATDYHWGHDFDRHGRDFFLAHNQRVRDELKRRGRPLLEIDVSQPGGLNRLCEYLGVDLPNGFTEFPNSDEWRAHKKKYGTGEFKKDKTTQLSNEARVPADSSLWLRGAFLVGLMGFVGLLLTRKSPFSWGFKRRL